MSHSVAERVALAVAGQARPLLVATDIDGTLAAIAPTPETAHLVPGAIDVLVRLQRLGCEVAVVSGRSMVELRDQFGLPRSLHLIGSHGAEVDDVARLGATEAELLDQLGRRLDSIVAAHPGARAERKPVSVALHVRGCEPLDATVAVDEAVAEFTAAGAIKIVRGHAVVEAMVRDTSKVTAVRALRDRVQIGSLAFLGDDGSDEAVFAQLGSGDTGIKIGPGATAATERLDAPVDAVRFLERLADAY